MLMTETRDPDSRASISAKEGTAAKLRSFTARLVQQTGRRITVDQAITAALDVAAAHEDEVLQRLGQK